MVTHAADVGQPWGILRGFTPTSLIDLRWTRVGYGSAPAPVLKVDNVVIDSPQGVGVYLDANAAFTRDSKDLRISIGAVAPKPAAACANFCDDRGAAI